MSRPIPRPRTAYCRFVTITSRWADDDAFGHVDDVVYYAWFDAAVNQFLIERGLLDLATSATVGIVAETSCRYLSQIAYPDDVSVGMRVAQLGRSSVRYELGVFREDAAEPSAEGHFVHVYVDRASMRPVAIPDHIRAEMAKLQTPN